MIQTFIEKNRKLLRFYYWVMRSGSWFFLLYAFLVAAGKSVALATRIGDWQEFNRFFHHDVPWGAFSNGLPTGLLALGIAQLIWYLLETDRQPGWVLRNADKLLYTYTAILISYYCWMGTVEVISHFNEPYDFPLRLIMLVIFILVKLLALVGAAEILRRALPMIEESRTLV
ncbi:MAG: hypothetical protein H8D47_01415 [Planctomycetes bacterium]|nr:hypothetical protein [Planctomycetota bacterium]